MGCGTVDAAWAVTVRGRGLFALILYSKRLWLRMWSAVQQGVQASSSCTRQTLFLLVLRARSTPRFHFLRVSKWCGMCELPCNVYQEIKSVPGVVHLVVGRTLTHTRLRSVAVVRTAQILKGNLLIGEWECSAAERPRTAG